MIEYLYVPDSGYIVCVMMATCRSFRELVAENLTPRWFVRRHSYHLARMPTPPSAGTLLARMRHRETQFAHS